jgi:hypothetical protein
MGFLKGLLFALAGKYLQTAIDVVKVEIAIRVVKAIGGARKLFMLLSVWIFLLTLIAVGLAMIPVALCVFMPWAPETKLIVALIFALIYIAVPVFLLLTLMSERRWLKMFHADELIQNIIRKKQNSSE